MKSRVRVAEKFHAFLMNSFLISQACLAIFRLRQLSDHRHCIFLEVTHMSQEVIDTLTKKIKALEKENKILQQTNQEINKRIETLQIILDNVPAPAIPEQQKLVPINIFGW